MFSLENKTRNKVIIFTVQRGIEISSVKSERKRAFEERTWKAFKSRKIR